jgi:WD40 repeat protein
MLRITHVFRFVLLIVGLVGPAAADDSSPSRTSESPKVDSFGDALPIGAAVRFGTIRLRHDAKAVAFLDKNTIVSVGPSIRFWNAANGTMIKEYRNEKMNDCMAATISVNGSRAITVNRQSEFCIWDLDSGSLVRMFRDSKWALRHEDSKNYREIPMSSDGKCFCAKYCDLGLNGIRGISEWRNDNGAPTITITVGDLRIGDCSISPDGKLIATILGQNPFDGKVEYPVRVWDAVNGKDRLAFDPGELGGLCQVQFAQSNNELIVVGHKATSFRDVNGKEKWRLAIESKKLTFVGESRGRLIFWAEQDKTETEALFVDGASGKVLFRQILRETGIPPNAVISPDGDRLAMVEEKCVRILTLDGLREQLPTRGFTRAVWSTCVSPNGRIVASAAGNRNDIILWDVATGREIRRLKADPEGCIGVVFSPNGKLLATRYFGAIHIYEAETGRKLNEIKSIRIQMLTGQCQFLEDNLRVAVAAQNEDDIRIFDWARGNELQHTRLGEEVRISRLVRHPSGRMVAISSRSDTSNEDDSVCAGIDVWDVESGKIVRHLPIRQKKEFRSAISPDGRTLATCDASRQLRIWEFATGDLRASFNEGDGEDYLSDGWKQSLSFSPDGTMLASAIQLEKPITIWDLASGKKRGSIKADAGYTNTVEFSPNGKLLFTGGSDTAIIGWDMSRPEWTRRRLAIELSDDEMEKHWERLRNGTPEQAYRSKWALVGSPRQFLNFLRGRLKPQVQVSLEQIKSWINELDAESYKARERAHQQLVIHIEQSEKQLRETLAQSKSAEQRDRITKIIDASFSAIPQPDQLQQLRAIEVLEQIGTSESRELLQTIAKSDLPPRITRDAAESLKRLETRPR